MKYWGKKEKLFKYVDGVRQFFPMVEEQLDAISRIIEKYNIPIKNFLDLGCGDGFLGNFIHRLYPTSHGVFLDCSKEMILKAQNKAFRSDSEYIVQDFGEGDWYRAINSVRTFDLIISGYSIHDIENDKKRRLYRDIYQLINPSGIFLNLEHVKSSSPAIEEIFNELFLEGMSDYQDHIGDSKTMEEIKHMYHDPQHKILNRLEYVELQCKWLSDIGFKEVDCYLKIFELALFGGIKS